MASTSGLTSDPLKVPYKIQAGTVDYGREYEIKVAALLSLRCLGKDTEYMWLATNSADCGYFDDIILYRQTRNGNTVAYLIQIRHSQNSKPLIEAEFAAPKGFFSFEKLFSEVHKLNHMFHEKSSSNIINYLSHVEKTFFIIFTNKSTSSIKFLLQAKENPDLNIINVNGDILQVQYQKSEVLIRLRDFDGELTNQLYFFTNQPHISNIDEQIIQAIEKLLLPLKLLTFDKLLQKYLTVIKEWSLGSLGGHYLLNQTHILKVLTEFLFEPYMVQPFYHYKFTSDYQISKLHKWDLITKSKNVTVVNMNNNNNDTIYKFLWDYFHEKVSQYAENEYVADWERGFTTDHQTSFFKTSTPRMKQEMLMTIGNRGKITAHSIYKVLCKLNEIPFLLEVRSKETYKTILRILELSNYAFNVIILNYCENEQLEPDGIPKPFINITDLNEQQCEMIFDEHIKLQGRSVQLKKLPSKCNFVKHMDVENIITILTGTFNIGNTLIKLPRYYLKRKISKAIITFSGDSKDDVNIPNQKVYHSKVQNENNLELLGAIDSSENVSSSVPQTKSGALQIEDFALPEPGEIKIITGSPGIGKTTTLNDLAQETPTDVWVLQIKLRDYTKYYNSKEFQRQDHFAWLKHVNEQILDEQKCANVTNINIFETFLNSQQVLLVLDGFDEISPTYKDKVTKMIHFFKKEGFRIWLATRSVLKTYVETEFNVLAVTLPKFTKEEQQEFLEAYFLTTVNEEEESIKKNSKRLLELVDETLNHYKEPLTGVPLHIEQLAKLFEPEIQTINFTIEDNLLNMCTTLISEKGKILERKYDTCFADSNKEDFEEHQKLIALHLLFSNINLNKQLDVLSDSKKSEKLQKDGVVMTDGNPANVSFVDQLLAEYLIATWIFENRDNDISLEVKNQNYGVINKLLEQIERWHQ